MTMRLTAPAAILVSAALLGMTGCTLRHGATTAYAETASEPDTSRLYRVYEYYPNAEVYFSSFQRMYYWHDGTEWQCGPALPEHIQLSRFDRERIKLPTSTPPQFHEQVLAKYPSLDTLLARRKKDGHDWMKDYERIVSVPNDP